MISVIILGFIQGIAEFLPISSSAHLIIFRDLFGIGSNISSDVALSFDIALHFGTLLAIGVFFFKDFVLMIKDGFTNGVKTENGRMMWYLVLATIPAAIMGLLFEEKIESVIRSSYILIALALILMGIIIYLVDKNSKEVKGVKDISWKDALIIGCSQVFALIPGFSRSGTTIATARCLGINREDAAKFSFYLSAPVVMGAVVLSVLKGNLMVIGANISVFLVGCLVSFVVGLVCIKYLLKYLRKNDFKIFMLYRIILGLVVILWVVGRSWL